MQGSEVHSGHRARMRRKLLSHGAEIFDTYELLEMLLYYAVPARDTNSIAKQLLLGFGSLEGVFSASIGELMSIDGVGERCAKLITELGATYPLLCSAREEKNAVFDSYSGVGDYLVRYFDENDERGVVMLLLDDNMRVLDIAAPEVASYGSGAVHSSFFIDAAMRCGATLAVVGFTHRGNIPLPYESELVTGRMVRDELAEVGVTVLEQFAIGGGEFSGTTLSSRLKKPPSNEVRRFLSGRGGEAL